MPARGWTDRPTPPSDEMNRNFPFRFRNTGCMRSGVTAARSTCFGSHPAIKNDLETGRSGGIKPNWRGFVNLFRTVSSTEFDENIRLNRQFYIRNILNDIHPILWPLRSADAWGIQFDAICVYGSSGGAAPGDVYENGFVQQWHFRYKAALWSFG